MSHGSHVVLPSYRKPALANSFVTLPRLSEVTRAQTPADSWWELKEGANILVLQVFMDSVMVPVQSDSAHTIKNSFSSRK